ncbi:MAG: hypothetical protein ABJN40_21875 [Sneathiella sp.]
MFFKKSVVWIVCCCFTLASCVTPGTSARVGPQFSSEMVQKAKKQAIIAQTKLDVIIPVFDPGIPTEADEIKENGIWPELRRAEANRFALKLKEELEKTGQFGAVRVTPDANATGDVYLIGKIVESNGADVEFDLQVYDITGKQWYAEEYEHEVPEGFHKNLRNKGKDPYQPAFKQAADDLVAVLKKTDNSNLALLQNVTEMRFGAHFSEEAFSEHLKKEGNTYKLVSLPSDDDPMLSRTRSIRIRDQLYVDNLQSHYEEFNNKMATSYATWQEQSQVEVLAKREADQAATTKAVLGVLAIVAAVGLAAASGNSGNSGRSTAAGAGAVVAGVGGAALLASSFRTSEESKFHRETLDELGESININLAPQVVDFENKTKELTGDAAKQFAEWRTFLKEIYLQEKTPEKQL